MTLDLNVATLENTFSGTSRRWISMSRRWIRPPLERCDVGSQRREVIFCSSLEHCDVGSQCHNVSFNHSLERCDVESQRRDVGCFPLWNVATLHLHVATWPCLRPKTPSFCSYPVPSYLKPTTSPSSSSLHPPLSKSTPTPVGGHCFALRPPHCLCHRHSLITPNIPLSLYRAFPTTPWCPWLG